MFQRILVPVDLSDRHAAALRLTGELCARPHGEARLLHVIELIPGLSVEEERPFYDRLEKAARAHLEGLAQRLERLKVCCHTDLRLGHRVEQIVLCAREMNADLMVLTSPPPDPRNVLAGAGSLSFRVGLVAPCPVLLVR
jgi:nucleotide-binding universal stress UspA family protein